MTKRYTVEVNMTRHIQVLPGEYKKEGNILIGLTPDAEKRIDLLNTRYRIFSVREVKEKKNAKTKI